MRGQSIGQQGRSSQDENRIPMPIASASIHKKCRRERLSGTKRSSPTLPRVYQAIWKPMLPISPCGSLVPSIIVVSSADETSMLRNLNAVTPMPT